jgi:hypothetical protein
MGIFGGKCVRCGKSLPYDGADSARTCPDCARHLDGQLEVGRLCPKDGSRMTLETVWNILVERCPECDGVWLDGGNITSPNDPTAVGSGARFIGELVV